MQQNKTNQSHFASKLLVLTIIVLVIATEPGFITRKDQISMKNFYEILEIEPEATEDHIKEQYLFLIQAWHPDKFPNPAQKTKAEEKTKSINAAYEILRDSVKRAEYDRSIRSSKNNQKQGSRMGEATQRQAKEELHKKEENAVREEPLRKEPANVKRNAATYTSLRVFIDGQERLLSVGELVKATVQYFDEETKEDMGFDYFRTHAAVRAAASRCLRYGIEIHVRQLAR